MSPANRGAAQQASAQHNCQVTCGWASARTEPCCEAAFGLEGPAKWTQASHFLGATLAWDVSEDVANDVMAQQQQMLMCLFPIHKAD